MAVLVARVRELVVGIVATDRRSGQIVIVVFVVEGIGRGGTVQVAVFQRFRLFSGAFRTFLLTTAARTATAATTATFTFARFGGISFAGLGGRALLRGFVVE
jgi:hypothetical protein